MTRITEPMPRRTKTPIKPVADDADLAARLAALPRDVQAGLRTLPVDQQREYLDSLDRLSDMEASGSTFVPTMQSPEDPPYGLRKDGKPKARPGRKAAQHPGARTAQRPARFRRDDGADLLADLPFTGDDASDDINYRAAYLGETPPATPTASPKAPTAAEREAAEREEYQKELEAALEAAGRTHSGRDIVTPVFTGLRRVEPVDPDDKLAVAHVEELQFRVTADDRQYSLEQLSPDGKAWQTVSSSLDKDGLAMHFAVHQIVVEGFGSLVVDLPRYRPKRQP
jgi:hypothetical protein